METLPVRHCGLSDYERAAMASIHAWRNPGRGWLGKAVDWMQDAWVDVTDLVRKVPGVEWTIENVVSGLLQVTNEITQDSVWVEAIHKEYRAAGHPVRAGADIRSLDLEHVDAAMRGLDAKYRALAAVEGATTGFAGASGIVPDLVALVALNLRAVGEYGTYCGFDMSSPVERLHALEILDFVSRSNSKARDVALVPVVTAASRVARKHSLQAMEQLGVARAIESLVKALGIRLTGAKLAQAVPVTGAVVGSSFNTYYTGRVCTAAFNLYRERFLFEKYGPDVLVEAIG